MFRILKTLLALLNFTFLTEANHSTQSTISKYLSTPQSNLTTTHFHFTFTPKTLTKYYSFLITIFITNHASQFNAL